MSNGNTLIAIDWGTSSLRAYLVGSTGEVQDQTAAPLGILKVPGGDFDRAFEETVGPWLNRSGDLPVVAAGMIGSRQGWTETPYVPCPAGVQDLADRLTPLRTGLGRTIWFVPGVNRVDEDNVPDVMRGEETQIIGGIEGADTGRGVFVLPGTHSKWAIVEEGRITWFATFMTGEVFAVLCEHSILGRLMEGKAEDQDAFDRGLTYGSGHSARRGGLLRRLFSTRTLGLFDAVPRTGLHAYLSGLLIGTEIGEAARCVNEIIPRNQEAVTIIGGSSLALLYARALQLTGFDWRVEKEDVVVQGLVRIASAAGLIGH